MRFAERDMTARQASGFRFGRGLLCVLAFMALAAMPPGASAVVPDISASGAYIEAEDYVTMGAANPWAWSVQSSVSGYQGTGYLYTTTGGTGTQPNGSRVDFPVNFQGGGTYQVWLRARDQAGAGGGDSTFWGIDGQVMGALTPGTDNTWSWTTRLQNGTNEAYITAGNHTINLWPREAGQHTDSIFIIRTDQAMPGNISEGSTAGVPTDHTALDFSGAGPGTGSGYITISDGQMVKGATIDPVKDTAVDSNDLVFLSDQDIIADNVQYRTLLGQSDGFGGYTVASKWNRSDIGGDTPNADPSVSNGVLSLSGAGRDIWNSSDFFTYLYQGGNSGDFTIDVKVNTIQNTNQWAKAGIMVRQSLATTSRHAMVVMTPGNGISFQRRTSDGATSLSTTNSGAGSSNRWLRLQRSGNTFTAYYSTDGTSWTQIGSDAVTMTDPVFIGLAVTSHNSGTTCTATFDNFLKTDNLMANTSGWTDLDMTPSFDASAAGWADGTHAMAIRSDNVEPETNTFGYSSCVDGSPSSITIPTGQTIHGSSVSLPSLFTTTGNVSNFTYQINGVGVNNPWNSMSYGTTVAESVDLTVTGIDPDCGGSTISKTQSVLIDNTCTDDTPSTITILTGQTTGGPDIDLTTLFSTSGNVGAFTYKINGNTVTSPWDSTSYGTLDTEAVTLTVTGTDPDCGGQDLVAINDLDIDNRCNEIDPTIIFPENPRYVAAGKSVAHTVKVYNNDSLNCDPSDFTLSIVSEDGIDSIDPNNPFDASTLTGGTQSIAGGGSATWELVATAKDGVPEWQENNTTLRVTVSNDANGHTHSTVDATTKTIVFLVSPITHNSTTTKSTKWGGNWGTSEDGSKYGNFTCLTCHEKHSPNVKWMKTEITLSDSSQWGGDSSTPVTRTVDFTDARDGSSDWGNDDPDGTDAASFDSNGGPGRTASTRSCEVCHSITQYHRYDTETDPDGAGPLAGQNDAQRRHFNDRDCMDCHRHDEGFTADCTNCHGNPPLSNTIGGPDGLADWPGVTGSTTAGTHYKHTEVLNYPCTYCHANYRDPEQMPKLADNGGTPDDPSDDLYDINHTFEVFVTDSGDPDYAQATAGNYTGQDGVYYEGVKIPPGQGTMTCENIYCHGGTDNMGGTNPQWNGNIHCNSCHGTSATNTPPGYSHTTHVGKMGQPCSYCHGANVGENGHVDGNVHIDLSGLAGSAFDSPDARYHGSPTATWDSGRFAPSETYGTCANVVCHFGTETPPWNDGPATCTTCHNNTGDDGTAGNLDGNLTHSAPAWKDANDNGIQDAGEETNHNEHVDPAAGTIHETMISAFVNKCESCHGAGANDGTHSGHINLEADFVGDMVYNADGSCSNYCHATDAGPNDWFSTANLPCQYCHMVRPGGTSYIGPTVVNTSGTGFDARDTDGNGTYWSSYGSHLRASTGDSLVGLSVDQWNAQCQKCHPYHEEGMGDVTVPEPTTNYTDSSSSTTFDLSARLGLQFPVTGGLHLGGTIAVGASEAQMCWGCHDSNSISEWNGQAYNGYSVSSSNWVSASFNAPGVLIPTRPTASIHSANPSGQSSSVGANVDTSGNIKSTKTLETAAQIRCSYCHDVHDMNRALVDLNAGTQEASSGTPFLRGSWLPNPYPLERPPENSDTFNTDNNWDQRDSADGNRVYLPRLYSNSADSAKVGGFFIDQNSGWPTRNADKTYMTVAETAGICQLCHGGSTDSMDYYGSSLWNGSNNGHRNSTLGGSGGAGNNIFDARRNDGSGSAYMWAQGANPNGGDWGDSWSRKSRMPSSRHFKDGSPNKPGKSGWTPPYNTGWYGGTTDTRTRASQYTTWFGTGIGNDGDGNSPHRAHNFSCSKCHTPHASGLPALLMTNCLDIQIGASSNDSSRWRRTMRNSNFNNVTVGPAATDSWARDVQGTCHRKDSNTTGWNKLAPDQ